MSNDLPDRTPDDEAAPGSDNPFGDGGFDVNALLQQAQQMQQQMMSAQEELAEARVDGTVADGLVTVTVNGTGELVGLKIREGSLDPSDPEALSDLEDLVLAAYRDARSRADALANEALGPLAGGLGGPEEGGSAPGGSALGF